MLPSLPRSLSARSPNATAEGLNSFNEVNRQSSAPSGFGLDMAATAAAGDGANTSLARVMLGASAAVAGNGCAAAKASRESRNNNSSAQHVSPSTSQQEVDEADAAIATTTTTTTTTASSSPPPARQAERLPDVHAGDRVAHDDYDDNPLCAASSASFAASPSFEHGPPSVEKSDRTAAADNVHLLQHMQQLLSSGASAVTLQQWISAQLQRASAAAGMAHPNAGHSPFLVQAQAVDGALSLTGATTTEAAGSTPSNPRRPTSAVSFSLVSTYPTSQPLSAKGSPFHTAGVGAVVSPVTPKLAVNEEDVSLVLIPPSLRPQSPLAAAATRVGSRSGAGPSPAQAASNAASPDDGDAVAAAGESACTTGSKVGLTAKTATVSAHMAAPPSPTRTGDGSKLVMPTPDAACRHGSVSVVSPPPANAHSNNNSNTNTSTPVIAANSGGLLKAPRTHTPGQQQWRSFHRGGSSSDATTHNVTNFSQASAATARRAQETNLHEMTKAVFHATTSRLIAGDQRSIGLLLGERFSRNPESMVRRLATPPASSTTTLTLNTVTTATEGRRHSNCSAGDSCLPSAIYDRADLSTTSPKARSPTMTKAVATVPLGLGSNFQPGEAIAIEGSPLPFHSQLYTAEDAPQERRRRSSVEQRGAELFFEGASTAATGVSERSTPIDLSTASTSCAATPQSMTPSAAGVSAHRGHCGGGVSLLNPSAFGTRRHRTSPHSSESTSTLPNSVPGTAGTLTCGQDALFPQHSPLVSPAVSPVAGAAAAAGKLGVNAAGLHSDGHHSLSPPSAVVAAYSASDAALPTAAEDEEELPSPVAGAAKRTTLANIIPLIDVVGEGDESTSANTMAADLSNSASGRNKGCGSNVNNNSSSNVAAVTVPGSNDGQLSKGLPRTWGMAAASPTQADSANAGNNSNAATLPPVNASVTSFAWMQSSSSMLNANASDSSPLTATSCGTPGFNHMHHHLHHHRTTQPYCRVASFISNTSSHLGTNASGSHATYSEGRSFFSLGEDMQSFESSRVSCVSGGRDGPLTGAGNNRLCHSSVLHLSHTSVNGGINPMADGVMPDFVLDGASAANRRPGPRFLRTYCRHSPVRVAESVTEEALAQLGIPYLSNIDEASSPMNVLHLMDTYNFRDCRAFYVVVCLNVMLRYNLVRRFAWDTQKLKKFLEVAASFFRDGNPFHHLVHATDLVLGAHQWLCEGTTAASLSDDELAAFLLTAFTLQLTHCGIDNRLLTQLRHPYAMMCSFTSPQQGAIVALVLALLRYPELHFFPDPGSAAVHADVHGAPLDPSTTETASANVAHEWTASRETKLFDMLSELVMATDLRNHAVLQQGILRMAEENAQRHGCLCAGAPLSPSRTTAKSGRRGGSGTPRKGSRSEVGGSRFHTCASPPASASPKQYRTSANGHICLNCCAYVTEDHVPDVLKGVLHYLGFPFLFRTYENYVSGSLMYVAEMYRQSEVEYKLFQQQQAAAAVDASESFSSTSSQPNAVSVEAFIKSTSTGNPQHDAELDNSTATFATAVMEEGKPWRQDVVHASTIASLQRRHSTEQPGSVSHPRRSTVTVAEQLHTAPGEAALSRPRSDSDDLASTSTGAPSTKAPRVRPLIGHGRDILLIGVEDLSLPFVELFAPYLPESWVRATYLNHQTFTVAMPSPEEYDEAVNRMLDLADEGEEEIVKRQEEDAGSKELMSIVPWLLLRRICPSNPDWTPNKDGVLRRVITEVVRSTECLMAQFES
ncbi:hypothetical protein N2W54_002354 [Lotmaria passim]